MQLASNVAFLPQIAELQSPILDRRVNETPTVRKHLNTMLTVSVKTFKQDRLKRVISRRIIVCTSSFLHAFSQNQLGSTNFG
jgi:hypothetical protein